MDVYFERDFGNLGVHPVQGVWRMQVKKLRKKGTRRTQPREIMRRDGAHALRLSAPAPTETETITECKLMTLTTAERG